jgi:hypothetical protein
MHCLEYKIPECGKYFVYAGPSYAKPTHSDYKFVCRGGVNFDIENPWI